LAAWARLHFFHYASEDFSEFTWPETRLTQALLAIPDHGKPPITILDGMTTERACWRVNCGIQESANAGNAITAQDQIEPIPCNQLGPL